MTDFIRAGIVGVGSIGKNHARIYSELPGVKFAAVFDTNREAADAISREHGVPVATTLGEFARMVDAATVSTPTPHHHEIGKFLLQEGKHLLIEKPITETPEQALELVKLAKDRGVVLQVGHVERFNPVLSALEQRLTKPLFIEAHRLSPYPFRSVEIGVVLDLMIHDLEIILHLVRSPVKSIDAVGIPVLSKAEDIANARIRFESGCVANVKIRVFQQDAYLSLDYQKQSGEMFRLVNGMISREAVEIEKDEPLKSELLSFVECSRKGIQPVVSGSQAAAALELAIEITGITKSATDELSRELGRQ
jgi:predicted dehydrogenase